MNAIFPIIAIFIFVLILFFLSQIVVTIIWNYKAKLKAHKTIENLGIAIALFFWFIILIYAIFSATNIFVNVGDFVPSKPKDQIIANSLNLEDCQKLIDKIYVGESQIYNLENHRYLELVSTPKNINSDYQKGVEVLRSVAGQYSKLDLNPESEYYPQIIAKKLQEKALFFEQRIDIVDVNKNKQNINQLLVKMDIVTQERLNAIKSVENQCKPE